MRGQTEAVSATTPLVSLTIPLLSVKSVPDEPAAQAVPNGPGTTEPAHAQLMLGGPSNREAIFQIDLPLLRRTLLHPEDLQQASISFAINGPMPDGIKLNFYRMLRDYQKGTPQPGIDFAPESLASLTVVGQQTNASPQAQKALAELGRQWLSGTLPDHGVLLAAEGSVNPPGLTLTPVSGNDFSLNISLVKQPQFDVFDNAIKPVAGVYTQVRNGKLYYGDKRLRLWGLNRNDSPNLDMVDRLWKVGFNAIRLWGPKGLWDDASVKTGIALQSHQGDGSPLDRFDHFFAALKNRGFFIWATGLQSDNGMNGDHLKALLDDHSFIAQGSDWPEWKNAVQEQMGKTKRLDTLYPMLLYFDPRTEEVFKRGAAAFLNHVNPYTGKRYAEEECIAVWQVQNENGFVCKLLEGQLDSWPDYFREELRKRWNAWLADRYHDQAHLEAAWGKLPPAESLDHASIQLGPTLSQRDKFSKARGDDFVHFAIDLVVQFNKSFEKFCRAQAPPGVGINVEPIVFDTQYTPSIPWLATSALSGDTVSISNYQWALTSSLSGPPSMYVFDNNTVKDKVTLVYETNSGNTNPFRGEFPLRVAALAGRQDWDGVFFHFYHAPNERNSDPTPVEMYLAGALQYITKQDYWSGTHFAFDPIMGSSIAVAGRIFLEGAIPPAKSPAVYRLADDAIFSYRHFNGIDQREDTFTRGSLISFTGQPTGDLQVDRSPVEDSPSDKTVTYDQDRQRLIIDAPMVHAYVGQTGGRYQFRDGIVVGDFNQPFISFVMVSADGRPLSGPDLSGKVFISAVNNAHNTGFDMDRSLARASGGFVSPPAQVPSIHSYGRAPILVDPVTYHLWFPTNLDYHLNGYDFALRRILEQAGVATNELSWDGKRDLFMNVLDITRHGGVAAVPKPEELPAQTRDKSNSMGQMVGKNSLSLTDVSDAWNPLPGIQWGDDYATTDQKLRENDFVKTSISATQSPDKSTSSIVMYEAQVIANAPANIEIDFKNARMHAIVASFTQAPSLVETVADYEKRFGVPTKKSMTSNAFETSTVVWLVHQKSSDLEIALTETQGSMEIAYTLTPL
jgi:hypothetical protein